MTQNCFGSNTFWPTVFLDMDCFQIKKFLDLIFFWKKNNNTNNHNQNFKGVWHNWIEFFHYLVFNLLPYEVQLSFDFNHIYKTSLLYLVLVFYSLSSFHQWLSTVTHRLKQNQSVKGKDNQRCSKWRQLFFYKHYHLW